jgi:hypothetical protein
MRKTILSWGAFALALISYAPTIQAQKKTTTPPANAHSSTVSWGNQQYLNIEVDSSISPPMILATYKSDALYNMIISQGRLTSLYVNARPIPSDSFFRYDGLVKLVIDQMRRDSAQAIRDREQAARDIEQAGRDAEQATRDKKQAARDAEQALRDKEQADHDAEQVVRDKAQAERDATQALREKKEAEKAVLDAKLEAERDKEQAARDREQAARDRDQAARDRQQAARDDEQALRDKKQAELDMQQAIRDKKQAEEDRKLLQSLLSDVVKEGLATDEQSIVSLTLDGSVFTVNGKKQSDALQKKFAEKYIREEGFGIYINGKVKQMGRMH